MFERFKGIGIFSGNNQIPSCPFTDQEIKKTISDLTIRMKKNIPLIAKVEKHLTDAGILENNEKVEDIDLTEAQEKLLRELEVMKKNQEKLQELLDKFTAFLNFKNDELKTLKP